MKTTERDTLDAYSETSPKLKMQKRNTTITLRVVFTKHYMDIRRAKLADAVGR